MPSFGLGAVRFFPVSGCRTSVGCGAGSVLGGSRSVDGCACAVTLDAEQDLFDGRIVVDGDIRSAGLAVPFFCFPVAELGCLVAVLRRVGPGCRRLVAELCHGRSVAARSHPGRGRALMRDGITSRRELGIGGFLVSSALRWSRSLSVWSESGPGLIKVGARLVAIALGLRPTIECLHVLRFRDDARAPAEGTRDVFLGRTGNTGSATAGTGHALGPQAGPTRPPRRRRLPRVTL